MQTVSDAERKLVRERRAEIAKQLGELRSVIRDLETQGLGGSPRPSMEQRQAHFDAVAEAKRKLHDLDLEYVKLS